MSLPDVTIAREPTQARKPFPLDRCHALRSDETAVARHYPKWYRPASADASPDKESRVSMGEQS
jgi:hypothetical protein